MTPMHRQRRARLGLLAAALALLVPAVSAMADAGAVSHWQIDLPTGCVAKMQSMKANWLYQEADQQTLKHDPRVILKPDFANMPAHTWLDLQSCFPAKQDFTAQWRLLPVAPYTRIYAADHQPDPDVQADFNAFGRWVASSTGTEGWFLLPFLDVGQAFVTLPKRLQNESFDGVRVLVQFDADGANLVHAGRLYYVYQGLNPDRSLFQLMIVPIQHPEFPSDDADTHLGFTWDQIYQSRDQAKAYQKQLAPWLQARAATMAPSLDSLDQMILSVRQAP